MGEELRKADEEGDIERALVVKHGAAFCDLEVLESAPVPAPKRAILEFEAVLASSSERKLAGLPAGNDLLCFISNTGHWVRACRMPSLSRRAE